MKRSPDIVDGRPADLFGYGQGAFVGHELILLRPQLARRHLLAVDPAEEPKSVGALALGVARRSLSDAGSNS